MNEDLFNSNYFMFYVNAKKDYSNNIIINYYGHVTGNNDLVFIARNLVSDTNLPLLGGIKVFGPKILFSKAKVEEHYEFYKCLDITSTNNNNKKCSSCGGKKFVELFISYTGCAECNKQHSGFYSREYVSNYLNGEELDR